MGDPSRGLYAKYEVKRLDGKPVGPCFVLEPDRDPFASGGLEGYAMELPDKYHKLADDLMAWANESWRKHNPERAAEMDRCTCTDDGNAECEVHPAGEEIK